MSASKKSMFRLLAFVAGMSIIFAACGGDDDKASDPPPPQACAGENTRADDTTGECEVVIDIGGEQFDCGEVVGSDGCGPETQEVFDEFGDNVDVFMNSGRLGAFNDSNEFYYEDVAYLGLVACTYQNGQENNYVSEVLADSYIADLMQTHGLDNTELLNVWFEAHDTLCPGLGYATPGEGTLP